MLKNVSDRPAAPLPWKLGAPGAIALATASIGVLIPIMRVLVEQAGAGSTAASGIGGSTARGAAWWGATAAATASE